MPSSSQQHRITTGLFYSTHAIILEKKWNKQFMKMRSKPLSELCTWGTCMSLSFAYVCLLLLLLSNDVEQNPGPEVSTQLSSSTKRCYHTCMEHMEQGWTNIQTTMKANAAFIHYDIGNRLSQLERMQGHMTHGLNELKAMIKDNTNTINILQSNQSNITRRLNEAQRESDKLEEMEKQSNIKILGLTESSDNYVDQVVNMLNHFSSDPQWSRNHIEKATRVGKRLGTKARAMIVTFSNLGDKVFVLRDTTMRGKLRQEGIRITSDLTTKQQAEIDFFKDKGFRAYYRRGILQVEDSKGKVNPQFVRDSYQQSNDYHLSNEEDAYNNITSNNQYFNRNTMSDMAGSDANQQQYPYATASPTWLSGSSTNGVASNQALPPQTLYPPLPTSAFKFSSPTSFTTVYGPNPSSYLTSPRHPYYHPTTDPDPYSDTTNFTISQNQSQPNHNAYVPNAVSHEGEPSSADYTEGGATSSNTTAQPTPAGLNDDVSATVNRRRPINNDDVFDDDDDFYNALDVPLGDEDHNPPSASVNQQQPDDSKDDKTYADAAATPVPEASGNITNTGTKTLNTKTLNTKTLDTNIPDKDIVDKSQNESNKLLQNQNRRLSNNSSKIPTANRSVVNSAVSHRVDTKSTKETKPKTASSSVDKDSCTKPKGSQANLKQPSVADYALRSRNNTDTENSKR